MSMLTGIMVELLNNIVDYKINWRYALRAFRPAVKPSESGGGMAKTPRRDA
jgi:hypothetical protein